MRRSDDPAPAPATVPSRPSRVGLVAGIAITIVAIAVAVSFAMPTGDDDGRLVEEVVASHDLGIEGPPPAVLPDAASPRDSFSDFAARAGWTPIGVRTDRFEGREAQAVFWGRAGRQVAHTVLPGDAAPPPDGARRTGRRGVLLHSFDAGPRTAVTWTEDGRTAVVSSIGVPRAELYDLVGGPPRT